MLSSNTVIVIIIATSTSTTLCDAWEVLEEEIIVDCTSMVLFGGIWDNRREKFHKGKDNLSMAGCSDMYTFAVCMGPMALADLGKMIVTKE